MARRSPPRKVTYFEPVLPRLARNIIIESTFDVGRRFRCTMRVDCGELDPGAVIRPVAGEWHPRIPERLDEEELADWRMAAKHDLLRRRCGSRPDQRQIRRLIPPRLRHDRRNRILRRAVDEPVGPHHIHKTFMRRVPEPADMQALEQH